MARNKNALLRYKTIDKCLQNTYRTWTLDDLIDACSDALYEYEGRDVNISRRTVQMDIQLMRSDKLGYNAPISVYEKKYYRYDEDDYSITNIPITEHDMSVLSETVEMLKQFKDFSLFSELGGIIQRLEDTVHTEKTQEDAIIHLDKNENLKGLEHLDFIYQAILKKKCIDVLYKSFKAEMPSYITFHPYILKEFNNRWFIVGRKNRQEQVQTFALDRIVSMTINEKIKYTRKKFSGDDYYKNTVGVTVLNDEMIYDTRLKIDRYNAPYVITKPFHSSQEIIEKHEDGSVTIQVSVHLNFEFERLILGFGDTIEVLAPRRLKNRIKKKLARASAIYN